MHIIQTEVPSSLIKFNEAKIKLHNPGRNKPHQDKVEWITGLQGLNWYGPFAITEKTLLIQTATNSGIFYGLALSIRLDAFRNLELHYINT